MEGGGGGGGGKAPFGPPPGTPLKATGQLQPGAALPTTDHCMVNSISGLHCHALPVKGQLHPGGRTAHRQSQIGQRTPPWGCTAHCRSQVNSIPVLHCHIMPVTATGQLHPVGLHCYRRSQVNFIPTLTLPGHQMRWLGKGCEKVALDI